MLKMLRIHFYFTMADYLANYCIYTCMPNNTLTADNAVYVAMAA